MGHNSGAPIQQRWKLKPRQVTKLLYGLKTSYWWNRKGVASLSKTTMDRVWTPGQQKTWEASKEG